MSNILPSSRPALTREAAEAILAGVAITDGVVAVLGRRGYYRDSMGAAGENDRGLYDDALFIVSARTFVGFNANTDPSKHRSGIATLTPGVWKYQRCIHNQSKDPALHPHYPAFGQAGAVTVRRDGGLIESGFFGINIHRGGVNTTSSEGCQTVPPTEWDEFRDTLDRELTAAGIAVFRYALTVRGEGDAQ